MRTIMSVLILAMLVSSPAFSSAQQMQPKDGMMMHGTMLEGVVTSIRYLSCGSTAQQCQGIFEITPSSMSKESMSSGDTMMHETSMAGDHMMMVHPVRVIVVPGTALIWQNSPRPLILLKVGDRVSCEYITLDNMNVVTKVTMTGMGHM